MVPNSVLMATRNFSQKQTEGTYSIYTMYMQLFREGFEMRAINMWYICGHVLNHAAERIFVSIQAH